MPEEKKIPKTCPKCGKRVVYFSGVNKEGKEYHFYGCEDRTSCRWIYSEPSRAELRHEEIMNALRYLYAKLRVIEEKVESIALKECNKPKEINEKKSEISQKMSFPGTENTNNDRNIVSGNKNPF